MAKYYICNICGNLIEMVDAGGPTPVCCNQPMKELIPASTDGAVEKHVPVIETTPLHDPEVGEDVTKVVVSVGSTPHPAETGHYIEWIALETNIGTHRVHLTPDCKPCVTFYIGAKEKNVAAYAYCNLHGLWVDNKNGPI